MSKHSKAFILNPTLRVSWSVHFKSRMFACGLDAHVFVGAANSITNSGIGVTVARSSFSVQVKLAEGYREGVMGIVLQVSECGECGEFKCHKNATVQDLLGLRRSCDSALKLCTGRWDQARPVLCTSATWCAKCQSTVPAGKPSQRPCT